MPERQLLAFAYRLPVIDRWEKPICVGDTIRVKRCVGKYGQTLTETGVVVEQGDDPILTLHAMVRYRTENGKFEYANIEYCYKTRRAICYYNHDDFEHAHESWVEVIDGKAGPASA